METLKILKVICDKKLFMASEITLFVLGVALIGWGSACTGIWYTILISLGTSFIASCVVILLDLWKQFSDSQILESTINVIHQAGIVKVYRKRDLDKYDSLMAGFKTELNICGYSLNAFFDSYRDLLIEKSKNIPGIKIKILIVDPQSVFSSNRAESEGNAPNAYIASLERLRKAFADYSNIEIRKIPTPLSSMIFRIDDTIFVGPHFYQTLSKSTITYELCPKGFLFEQYLEEFNRMWEKAQNANSNVV